MIGDIYYITEGMSDSIGNAIEKSFYKMVSSYMKKDMEMIPLENEDYIVMETSIIDLFEIEGCDFSNLMDEDIPIDKSIKFGIQIVKYNPKKVHFEKGLLYYKSFPMIAMDSQYLIDKQGYSIIINGDYLDMYYTKYTKGAFIFWFVKLLIYPFICPNFKGTSLPHPLVYDAEAESVAGRIFKQWELNYLTQYDLLIESLAKENVPNYHLIKTRFHNVVEGLNTTKED